MEYEDQDETAEITYVQFLVVPKYPEVHSTWRVWDCGKPLGRPHNPWGWTIDTRNKFCPWRIPSRPSFQVQPGHAMHCASTLDCVAAKINAYLAHL